MKKSISTINHKPLYLIGVMFCMAIFLFSLVSAVTPTIDMNYPLNNSLIDYGAYNGNLTLNFTIASADVSQCWINYNNTNYSANSNTTQIISPAVIDAHGADLTSSLGGATSHRGFRFVTNYNLTNLVVTKHPSVTATTAYLLWANGTQITSSAFSTDTATFTGIVLKKGEDYRIEAGSGVSSYTLRYLDGQTYPTNLININLTKASTDGSDGAETTMFANIISITTSNSTQSIKCNNGVPTNYNLTLTNQKNLTLYANDTAGNLASEVINWDYKVFENSFSYNNQTQAGGQEDFTLNTTLSGGYDISSAIFVWGNLTQIPNIIQSGNNIILSIENYQIQAFPVDTNVSIYFNITLNDSSVISTMIQNQLVGAILLDNCSTYTYPLFNISLFDEASKTPLLGDIEIDYTLLNVPAYSNINSISFGVTNKSSVRICSVVDLSGQNFVQSVEIRYVADGYEPELYNIQRANITTSATNVSLYDLNSSDSTKFKITYQDSTFNFIDGAIIQLQRKYISEGIYETVEAPLTSLDGTSIVHIDLNSIKYRATVVKNGVVLDEFDDLVFQCQSELTGECEQKLLGKINPQNDVSLDNVLDFYYTEPILNNGTITLSFSVPSGTPASINLVLEQKDQFANKTICNKTVVSSAGSISCTYSETLGDSYIDLYLYKDGQPIAIKTYIVHPSSGLDWLGNNYIFILIILLSLVGMALSSPEWIIINGIITMVISGALFLASGLDFVMGLGNIMWLVIAALILIAKISKQEDR